MKSNVILSLLLLLTCFSFSLQAIDMPTTALIPISVSVTGDVSNPGVYTFTTTNRLSDAIAAADHKINPNTSPQPQVLVGMGVTIPQTAPATADSIKNELYHQRNIILIRQGNKQTLDLLKFFRTGDISQNPLLMDGDVLVVQPVHETVSLEGKIVLDGEYEYRNGDTLKDLLELALGFNNDADLKHVMLYRYSGDYTTFEKQILDLSAYPANPEVAAGYILEPGDRILVPVNSEFRKVYKITVTGKVKNPGVYYVNDHTSLYDLMLMCGGPTKEADLNTSYMYNQLKSENFDPDFNRLKTYTMLQMTWMEYSYLRTKERQLRGKYAIDIKTVWDSQGSKANQTLRDGDELIVPEVFNSIWVTGQVKYPGIVDFKEGMTWKEYIGNAGGYTNNRKFQGVRIIRAYSGNWVKPSDNLKLRPGDTIFVSEREEITTWSQVKDVILLASQVLTVILTLRTLNVF